MAIQFFEEDIKFSLKEKNKHKRWLKVIAEKQGYRILDLNYIFCSDEYLYKINLEYLNHNTYTDIITFDNSEEKNTIEGDIFISIERIKENAEKLNNAINIEILRVMSHGLMHLMGYKDKSKEDKKLMNEMEDNSILLYQQFNVSRGTDQN
ncbi:rRNA maturation RNase YbeY [Aquiflexum lacus]|uniref:rRNA maturation RNase YbeY n=1 Tax=Aquiflexum lacus TaxID=2483805 RepID=UPI001893F1FA|nr:rRNA maturation RNase YbeY [Aquiflexum lacus]